MIIAFQIYFIILYYYTIHIYIITSIPIVKRVFLLCLMKQMFGNDKIRNWGTLKKIFVEIKDKEINEDKRANSPKMNSQGKDKQHVMDCVLPFFNVPILFLKF